MESNYLQPLIKYDQNLMFALYVLLREKHISNSAKHLCISQSAVSQKLSKLRYIFNDNLLVRINNEMVLTPFALALYPMLEAHISSAIDIFHMRYKANDTLKKVYRICIIDGIGMDIVSKKSLDIIKDMDFTVAFEIITRYDACVEDLNNGNLDLLIGSFDGLSNNIHQVNIGEMEYGLFADENNKFAQRINDKIAFDELYNEKFIDFKFHGKLGANVKNFFNDNGGNINTILSYSQYELVARSLIGTDFLAFIPVGMVSTKELLKLDLDTKLPKGKCYMYWHSVMENDLFHKYLRNSFVDLIRC
ncbi:TPA: LysR substrate-binding domain-containing protein [Photobacterium damselae]